MEARLAVPVRAAMPPLTSHLYFHNKMSPPKLSDSFTFSVYLFCKLHGAHRIKECSGTKR